LISSSNCIDICTQGSNCSRVFGGSEDNTVFTGKCYLVGCLGAVTLLSLTHKASEPSSKKKKSELCFDIHESQNDHRIQNVIEKIEFLP